VILQGKRINGIDLVNPFFSPVLIREANFSDRLGAISRLKLGSGFYSLDVAATGSSAGPI